MPFSKFKAFLRKVSERTVRGLCRRIGSFVPTISRAECRNYFQTCRLRVHMTGICSKPLKGECIIWILKSIVDGKRFNTIGLNGEPILNVSPNLAITFRHELGHCNGWTKDHPDARKAYLDERVSMPTLPPSTKWIRTVEDCEKREPTVAATGWPLQPWQAR
jgi:hypothetical protein